MKRKERILRTVRHLKTDQPNNELNHANAIVKGLDRWTTGTMFVGPILQASVTYVFDTVVGLQTKAVTAIFFGMTVLVIIAGVTLQRMTSYYQAVVTELERDESIQKIENGKMKDTILGLKKGQKFLVNFTGQLSGEILKGNTDISELANLLAVNIYLDCTRRFGGSTDFTVNIYTFSNDIIRMVGHYQDEIYSEPPLLVTNPEGKKIQSTDYSKYYCVQCITGKEDFYALEDWKAIVNAFYWRSNTREELLQSREKCLVAGITYNQYIGCRITLDRRNDVVALLEIVSHNETKLNADGSIERAARKFYNEYTPLIRLIWSIAHEGKTVAQRNAYTDGVTEVV